MDIICHAKPVVDAAGALQHIIIRGIERRIEKVSMLLNIEPKQIMRSGKYPQVVAARSLVCYWASRELGMTTVVDKMPVSIYLNLICRKPDKNCRHINNNTINASH
jgi:hypothetical protein